MFRVNFDSVFCATVSLLSHALIIWTSAMILFILGNFTFLESQNNSSLLDIRSRHWKSYSLCLSHTVGILSSLVTWPAILNQMLSESYLASSPYRPFPAVSITQIWDLLGQENLKVIFGFPYKDWMQWLKRSINPLCFEGDNIWTLLHCYWKSNLIQTF